jgi:hypothetical protein
MPIASAAKIFQQDILPLNAQVGGHLDELSLLVPVLDFA